MFMICSRDGSGILYMGGAMCSRQEKRTEEALRPLQK